MLSYQPQLMLMTEARGVDPQGPALVTLQYDESTASKKTSMLLAWYHQISNG